MSETVWSLLTYWVPLCCGVAFLLFVGWCRYRFLATQTRVCPTCQGLGYIDLESAP